MGCVSQPAALSGEGPALRGGRGVVPRMCSIFAVLHQRLALQHRGIRLVGLALALTVHTLLYDRSCTDDCGLGFKCPFTSAFWLLRVIRVTCGASPSSMLRPSQPSHLVD